MPAIAALAESRSRLYLLYNDFSEKSMPLRFISRIPIDEWEQRERRTRCGEIIPQAPLPKAPRTIPASIVELADDRTWGAALGEWRRDVAPLIAADPEMRDRADREWNWNQHRVVALLAGARRKPRFFQIRVGSDNRPAAMMLLLGNERWPGEETLPATYLWYLSVATRGFLTYPDGSRPIDVGLAAIDAAITVSLRSAAGGRVWLRADPNAGQPDLCKYYGLSANMARVPAPAVPRLPGYIRKGLLMKVRPNDGRYFAFTPELARWAYRRLDWLRGQPE